MNTHLVFSKIQATKHCWPKKSLRSIDSWPDRRSSWSQGNQLVNSVEMNCFFLVCCDPTPDSWRWIWLQRVQFWTSLRGPLQTRGNGKLLEFFCWETNRFCWERSFEIVGCKTNASNGDVLKCYFARLQILVCSANSEFSSTVDIYSYSRQNIEILQDHRDPSLLTELRTCVDDIKEAWYTQFSRHTHTKHHKLSQAACNVVGTLPILLLQPLDGLVIQQNNAQVRLEFSGPITTPYLRFDAPQTFGWRKRQGGRGSSLTETLYFPGSVGYLSSILPSWRGPLFVSQGAEINIP